MHKADLQIGIIAGEHINEINLLTADDLCEPLPVLVGQHIQIGMRQLVTQDVNTVDSAQNTNTDWRRGNNFTVKLFMFFQTLGIAFRRDKNTSLIHTCQHKQRRAHQHIQQNSVEDQHANTFQHQIDRDGIHNTER